MLGAIEFENFEGLTSMPQSAASAWSAVDGGICGTSYKPLIYVGKQIVRGINHWNHWFIAEQTLVTNPLVKHIVTIAINEFNGVYAVVPNSIEVIIA